MVKKLAKISSVIFIIPHYDDELGVFNQIMLHKLRGHQVIIIYLTSSNKLGKTQKKREDASLFVLEKLGVNAGDQIIFLGGELKIPDLKLIENLDAVFAECLKRLSSFKNIIKMYTTAYEGGHPDHDCSFLLTITICRKLNILEKAYQFPMYSGKNLPGSFFRLFVPLSENGKIYSENISMYNRFLYIKLFFSYFIQQPKTILGLSLHFAFHILLKKRQIYQKASLDRVWHKPHKGFLLYERRRMLRYDRFKETSKIFLNRHLSP